MDKSTLPNKTEWDRFLREHADLVQKCRTLLVRLDRAENKLVETRKRTELETTNNGQVIEQLRSTVERLCKETEEALGQF